MNGPLGELGNAEYIKKVWILDDNQTNIKKGREITCEIHNILREVGNI